MEKDRQLIFLKERLKELKKECNMLYNSYSYYKKLNAEYESKSWRKARFLYKKIEESCLEGDSTQLAGYKAKANCYLGRAYTEKGDYDEALIYLKRAERHIERGFLQYKVPKIYIYTMIHMAKCYIEKHSPNSDINRCLDNAKLILERMKEKREKFGYEKIALELTLQQAIAGLDSYGQPKKFDEKKVWEILKEAESHFKELSKLEREKQRECRCDFCYGEWKEKQRETLDTTKGEHVKKLYFFLKESVDFLKNHENDQNRKRERLGQLGEIQKQLGELLKTKKNCQVEDKHLNKLIEWAETEQFSITDGDAERNVSRAEKLRECCMEIAFDIFVEVIQYSPHNTISMGNCAALLYDYYYNENGGNNNGRNEGFLKRFLEHYGSQLEKIGICTEKTIRDNIQSILKKILEIDSNNMFALNIYAALPKEDSGSGSVELEHYPALRQSSLKKRFALIDTVLEGRNVDVWQKIKINLIILHSKIIDFMNVTTVDFTKEEWNDLKVAHYTKLNVIPKLINKKGNSKQRLQNVRHLNDPMEGALFVEHLKAECFKDEENEKEKSSENGTSLIREVIDNYELEKRSQIRNSVYMGSFSGRLDQLNMWSRYGDNACGCCFQIDAKKFFDRTSRVSLAELSTNDGPGQYKLEDMKYPLYTVLYLPEIVWAKRGRKIEKEKIDAELKKKMKYAKMRAKKEKDDGRWWKKQERMLKKFIELKRDVAAILGEIQEDFVKIESEETGKIQEELCNIIMAILDLARFLFKGENYQDEREYRVIQYATDPEYDENIQGSPRLYVEMEKEFICETVCFGPKASEFEAYATYIQNIKKDAQDGQNKENWKINIQRSGVCYR